MADYLLGLSMDTMFWVLVAYGAWAIYLFLGVLSLFLLEGEELEYWNPLTTIVAIIFWPVVLVIAGLLWLFWRRWKR